jgi:ketosteroid isomerase-like protein
MSQENVELFGRAFAAFNEGGSQALFEQGLWSADLVLDVSHAGIPGFGVYRGIDEVNSFFADDWFAAFPFESWEQVLEKLIDADDKVVSHSVQRGRGKASDVPVELQVTYIGTVRDGVVVRFDVYLDRQKALEAAGLSESDG